MSKNSNNKTRDVDDKMGVGIAIGAGAGVALGVLRRRYCYRNGDGCRDWYGHERAQQEVRQVNLEASQT